MLQLLAQSTIDYTNTVSDTGSGIFSGTFLLVVLALIVIGIIGMWKVFTKAGQPGWAAIVPFYNLYVLTQVAGREWWWMLLMLVPYVGFIFQLIIAADVAKRFGKSAVWGVILCGILGIGYVILGFGSAMYQANQPAANNTPATPPTV
jgi:hypothetical protein